MRHLTHVIIRGQVQGVSFRAWTLRLADSRGIDGWVRNREDGGVEAMLAGEADAVGEIVEAFRTGPDGAVVTDVIALPASEEPEPGFHIRR